MVEKRKRDKKQMHKTDSHILQEEMINYAKDREVAMWVWKRGGNEGENWVWFIVI